MLRSEIPLVEQESDDYQSSLIFDDRVAGQALEVPEIAEAGSFRLLWNPLITS